MNTKIIFVCVAASLVQVISGQCLSSINPGLLNAGQGCGCNSAQAISGGGFPVSSSSSIAPNGIYITSDIGYDGCLSANGQLPFLGTVGFEGPLPSAGQGGVNYGCGNSDVGITSQGINSAPSYQGLGSSCGCGRRY